MAGKTKNKTDCGTLTHTRLLKLKVERLLPPGESADGTLELNYSASLSKANESDRIALLGLAITGGGKAGDSENPKTAFTIDAAIEGIFEFKHDISIESLEGKEIDMALYLIPLLADIVESNLSKMGYAGIKLPCSFPLPQK